MGVEKENRNSIRIFSRNILSDSYMEIIEAGEWRGKIWGNGDNKLERKAQEKYEWREVVKTKAHKGL